MNQTADQPEWEDELTSAVAAQIRYWREQRDLTAQQLSQRTAELGHRISSSVIANLENNRRGSITLTEILILSAGLNIPPILLVAPVGRVDSVHVLPGMHLPPWETRGWVHGVVAPHYRFFSIEDWRSATGTLNLYEVHRTLVRRYSRLSIQFDRALSDEDPDLQELHLSRDLERVLRAHKERRRLLVMDMHQTIVRLKAHRELMAEQGLLLPTLPAELEDQVLAVEEHSFGGTTVAAAEREFRT